MRPIVKIECLWDRVAFSVNNKPSKVTNIRFQLLANLSKVIKGFVHTADTIPPLISPSLVQWYVKQSDFQHQMYTHKP